MMHCRRLRSLFVAIAVSSLIAISGGCTAGQGLSERPLLAHISLAVPSGWWQNGAVVTDARVRHCPPGRCGAGFHPSPRLVIARLRNDQSMVYAAWAGGPVAQPLNFAATTGKAIRMGLARARYRGVPDQTCHIRGTRVAVVVWIDKETMGQYVRLLICTGGDLRAALTLVHRLSVQ